MSEKGKHIPIVVLTAHAYAGEKKEAEDAGADYVGGDDMVADLSKRTMRMWKQ